MTLSGANITTTDFGGSSTTPTQYTFTIRATDAEGQYLESLNSEQANALIDTGVIAGGMIAKVNAALQAARQLRRSIAVASWQSPEQIVDLLNGECIGTRIQPC
jgi:acetylglutamate kinase